jgi:Flp pilus assembly protein TadD
MKPNRPQLQKVPSPAALASLGQAFNQRRYAEMEQLALVLTRDYPQLALGWKALGIALKQMGRAAEALLPMQTAIELNLSDSEAHNNLGNVMKTLGRFAEAEICYRQAIALKPDYVEAYGNLGVTLQGLGRLDEAEACYRQAIALKPDYVEAHKN